MIDTTDLHELVRIANRAARLAQDLQARARSHDKADGTVVTQADVLVEERLREDIEAAFGAVAIVGEEAGGTVDRGAAIVIDPIDGTLSYSKGSPLWSVSVGVLDGGRPVAGVIAAPCIDRTWAGAAGLGAMVNGRPIRPRPVRLTRHALIAVTTEAVRRYGAPPSELGHLRCLGGIALQIAMCADASVDVALCCKWSLWDVVGAVAIVLAAGGHALWAADGSDAAAELCSHSGQDLVVGGPGIEKLVPSPIPMWHQAG